ncbi:MAG: hypothetical protein KJP01_07340 [Gramella sp.]|nr:hypothetical protein [Christiangramia sp.]
MVESLDFSDNTIHPDNLNLALNSFYLTIGKSVYKYELGDSLPATLEFSLEEVSVLYGLEISDNKIYVASPRPDFTGNGDLYIYDLSTGNLLDQFSAGINPNGIYFN